MRITPDYIAADLARRQADARLAAWGWRVVAAVAAVALAACVVYLLVEWGEVQ